MKVTCRGGPFIETSGCINLTCIIPSDSWVNAGRQLMTHSIALTLILLKKKQNQKNPVTFKTIQIWQNNEHQVKGLLEPVRLPGCNRSSFDFMPFWYSVLLIASSIWVAILLDFRFQEFLPLIESGLSPSQQNYFSPLVCTDIWASISKIWVPALVSIGLGVFFGVLIHWEVTGSFHQELGLTHESMLPSSGSSLFMLTHAEGMCLKTFCQVSFQSVCWR